MGIEGIPTTRRFWIQVSVAVFVGVLLSAAYIAPFYNEFLVDNAGRVGRDYNFAVSFIDTFAGTINNFFQPLRSDVHGVFGGSSLFLLAAFVPLLRLFRIRIPLVIWCIWGAALFVFLHMQGPRTLVHYLTWKYFPLASSIRVPGRLSLILPMLFLLLLTWVVQDREEKTFYIAGRQFHFSSKEILAAFSFVAIGIYLILPDAITNHQTDYSAFAIRNIPPWLEPTAIVTGLAGLILFVLYKKSNQPLLLGALLGLFVCLQAACLLAYGTWVVPKSDTDQFAKLRDEKKGTLDYRHLPGSGLYSSTVMQHVKHTHLEPYIAQFYKYVIPASDGEDAYRLIKMDRRANQVIVEGCSDCGDRYSMPQKMGFIEDRIELVYSSYNRLEFEVDASTNGILGLAFPYSGRWKAFINGREVSVYRANGAANAVKLQPGVSRVEFRYWSTTAIWGMLLSCLTASLIGISLSVFNLRKTRSILGVVIAVAGGIGLFALWYHSLYTGHNLNTDYVWTSIPDNGPLNLAYGKPTRTRKIFRESYPKFFYSDQFLTLNSSGKAVDGNRTTGSGFVSNAEEKPYWYVDLNRPRDIGSLVLYENRRTKHANQRPLLVGLSDNGKEWRTATVIRQSARGSKLTVSFEPVEKARFLLVQSANFCRLAIDEIEIYPPSYD